MQIGRNPSYTEYSLYDKPISALEPHGMCLMDILLCVYLFYALNRITFRAAVPTNIKLSSHNNLYIFHTLASRLLHEHARLYRIPQKHTHTHIFMIIAHPPKHEVHRMPQQRNATHNIKQIPYAHKSRV